MKCFGLEEARTTGLDDTGGESTVLPTMRTVTHERFLSKYNLLLWLL